MVTLLNAAFVIATERPKVKAKPYFIKDFWADDADRERASEAIKKIAVLSQSVPGKKTSVKQQMNHASKVTQLEHGVVRRIWYREYCDIPHRLMSFLIEKVQTYERLFDENLRAAEATNRQTTREVLKMESEMQTGKGFSHHIDAC